MSFRGRSNIKNSLSISSAIDVTSTQCTLQILLELDSGGDPGRSFEELF